MGEHQQSSTSGSNSGQEPERQNEAKRILDRLAREQTDSMIQRGMSRTAHHLTAHDVDKNDLIELWSTRIGRFLGLLITFSIIVWLVIYLMQS